jgi:hypothetical protein
VLCRCAGSTQALKNITPEATPDFFIAAGEALFTGYLF